MFEHARAARTTGLCVHSPLILVPRWELAGEEMSTLRGSISSLLSVGITMLDDVGFVMVFTRFYL